jgi:hypothetical protein
LSDKERDEIDFSVKVALRKSVDRVRQLEQLEQGELPTHSLSHTGELSTDSECRRFSTYLERETIKSDLSIPTFETLEILQPPDSLPLDYFFV